jgi:predicted site-specific integrase-resolvase
MAILITSDEVCELLGIKPNNLHQIEHRKQLKWVEKKGKRVYYNFDDVEALKTKRATKGK